MNYLLHLYKCLRGFKYNKNIITESIYKLLPTIILSK
jgi:hypothetical protein